MSTQKKPKEEVSKSYLKRLLSRVMKAQKEIEQKLEDISRTCKESSKEL